MTCSATSAIPSGPRAAAGAVSARKAIAAAVDTVKPAPPKRVSGQKAFAPMGVSSPEKRPLKRLAPTYRRFKGTANQYHARLGFPISPGPPRHKSRTHARRQYLI